VTSGDFYVLFVTCHPGLERAVTKELCAGPIGIPESDIREGKAGVHVRVRSLDVALRACLWLRSGIRVLARLWEGDLDLEQGTHPGDAVYACAREAADWPALLPSTESATLRVSGAVHDCGPLVSSQLLAARIRDAACDAVRDRTGHRPPPPGDALPDLPLHAVANRGRLTIYRDLCGRSLHRRGYRQAMHRASLNEAAAAGCLVLAGWPEMAAADPEALLLDPMCGSGTFLIEGAMMARRIAPGLARRDWPFLSWPDVSARAWDDMIAAAQAEAQEGAKGCRNVLLGNDIHAGALSLAQRDVAAAGVEGVVKLRQGPCRELPSLPRPASLVVTNPPWGLRLDGDAEVDAAASWRDLGDMLKQNCAGASAFALSGSRDLTKHLRLRASARMPITIGDVDCRLLRYDIQAGPWKGAAAPGEAPREAGSDRSPLAAGASRRGR